MSTQQILSVNAVSWLVSLSEIEKHLQIALLIVSILLTVAKILELMFRRPK